MKFPAIHHVNEEEKQVLYADLYEQLEPKGSLAIADLIKPQTEGDKEICAIHEIGPSWKDHYYLKVTQALLMFPIGWNGMVLKTQILTMTP